jgi:hypothetical protein
VIVTLYDKGKNRHQLEAAEKIQENLVPTILLYCRRYGAFCSFFTTVETSLDCSILFRLATCSFRVLVPVPPAVKMFSKFVILCAR